MDEKYLEFQRLCFDNPELDIFDIRDSAPSETPPLAKKKELIAFTILFSVFERAFIMYSAQSKEVRREQWQGWADYIASYCERTNFREAWNISGKTFDVRFQQYMTAALNKAAPDLCAASWGERLLKWRPWPSSEGLKRAPRDAA